MKEKLMPFAAVLAGLFIAFILFLTIQSISSIMYPFPEGLDPFDPNQKEAFEAYLNKAPIGMFLIVLLGYMLGSFAGGYLSSFILKMHTPKTAIILGLLLTLAGISNLMSIPHPTWFAIINIPSFFIFVWLGSKLVTNKTQH